LTFVLFYKESTPTASDYNEC